MLLIQMSKDNNRQMIRTRTITITITLILTALVSCMAEPVCDDSLTINDTTYQVPEFWHPHKLDSTEIAKPENLVRLPDELTFEDFRIYVLPETRDAFVSMATEAAKDSVSLRVDSGFRSPAFQRRVIKRRLSEGGEFAKIIKMVAPPGYSQHHTGRAIDLVPSEALFVKTDAYRWLTENADRFGFTESYPKDNADSVFWEPYHWYYAGDAEE